MKRAILAPAYLAGTALDELKQWLAISTTHEDAMLTSLIRTSIDMCEAFTGSIPLETEYEESLPAAADWQHLGTRPVEAISGMDALPTQGARYTLPVDTYAVDLDADGGGRVRLTGQSFPGRIAVRYTAGIAAEWGTLPDSLRHGIIRLAAHYYRERDMSPGGEPPAAIVALWRPWRRLRLL